MTTTTQVEINTNAGINADATTTNPNTNNLNMVATATSSSATSPGICGNVTSTQRVVEATKRKKLKSRSANASNATSTQAAAAAAATTTTSLAKNVGKSNGNGLSYSKEHLDAWLENCLRDATQLSSSSEFLDFNPPTVNNNKQIFVTQQQQQQQHQQQQQQQQQQQFLMRSNSQPYGMGPSPSMPFSLGIQRHSQALSHRYPMLFPPQSHHNGYGLAYGDSGQDFASLPPLVNMMGSTGPGGNGGGGGHGVGGGSGLLASNLDHEQNSTDVLDGSGSNPTFSRGFRFSDPCLLNPSDNDSKLSGQNTPDRRNGSATSGGNAAHLHVADGDQQQNKFFAALMEQINILHETNSKICRNLHDTKVDIEALKHAPNGQPWAGAGGMRHRRDSLSGLSTQSQPMVFGGGFGGTHSPAPTFHSAYTPGMMTDVVREVKEAARVREDALLSRVKSMVEERQWTLNEGNVRTLRDIDELKSQVMQLRLERKETNKRLSHLEAENKYLRQAFASCFNQRQTFHDIIYENERAQRSRKPFPNGSTVGGGGGGGGGSGARRSQSFNLHYGTMHQTPTHTTHLLDEDDEGHEEKLQPPQLEEDPAEEDSEVQSVTAKKRLSTSSNDSRNNGLIAAAAAAATAQSPPTFSLLNEQVTPSTPPPLLPRKKEHAQLKRELNEAAAARKEANQRIIALEKLVKDLSAQVASQPNWNPSAAPAITPKFTASGGPITDL